MTSPPLTVPRARQVEPSIVSLDEADAAVAEQDIDAAGVVAPRRDRGEGRAAVLLADGDQVGVGDGRRRRSCPGVTLFGGQAVVNPAWLVLPSSHSAWPESGRSSAIAAGATGVLGDRSPGCRSGPGIGVAASGA